VWRVDTLVSPYCIWLRLNTQNVALAWSFEAVLRCAGFIMQEQTDWADLSEQLLLRTFESQYNAPDNCAAACACKSWRSAATYSLFTCIHITCHTVGE